MVGANLPPPPELNRVKSKRPGFILPQEMFQIEYIWLKFVCAAFSLILLCLVAFCWSNCTSIQSIALLGKVAKILQRLRKPYPQIGTLELCSFQDHIWCGAEFSPTDSMGPPVGVLKAWKLFFKSCVQSWCNSCQLWEHTHTSPDVLALGQYQVTSSISLLHIRGRDI